MVQQLYRGWAWLGVVAVGVLRALPCGLLGLHLPGQSTDPELDALALGRVAIKRLAVLRGRIDRLSIEELEVTRLTVEELTVERTVSLS